MVGRITEMSGLIANPGKIWLAVEPVDMRRGIDGLLDTDLDSIDEEKLKSAFAALEEEREMLENEGKRLKEKAE